MYILRVFVCSFVRFLFVSSFYVCFNCVLKGVFVVVYCVWYVLCCCLHGVIKHDDDDDYILCKAFVDNYFSVVENYESLQTIHDKQKYQLQQLFEILSPSLDTGLESLVSGPVNDGLFEVSTDLKQSLLQFRHVAYWLLAYKLLHATPDSAINAI